MGAATHICTGCAPLTGGSCGLINNFGHSMRTQLHKLPLPHRVPAGAKLAALH